MTINTDTRAVMTPNAEAIGRAIFNAIDPHPLATWDTVPESFRKLYTWYGARVEADLYVRRIRPAAPLHVLPPALVQEIRTWSEWWKSDRAERRRPTRPAHQILADVARRVR